MSHDWHYVREQRIVNVFLLLLILFILIALRLSNLQVFNNEFLSAKAYQQARREVPLEIKATDNQSKASRGNFLDRQGKPILGSYEEERVVVYPQFNKDLVGVSFLLGNILDIPGYEIKRHLDKKPTILPYSLSPEAIREIKTLNLAGVEVAPVSLRYGEKPLAVNLVGYLNHSGEGATGLEEKYNKYLVTESARSLVAYVNARGDLISSLGYQVENKKGSDRRNVVLTLDYSIQKIVEEVMDELVDEGAVIVMDRFTGDILASATRPTINPVNLQPAKGYDKVEHKDKTVQYSSPGSVFKVLVAAAAIEEGIADVDTVFYCDPESSFFECEEGRHNLAQAIAQSCNNTFAQLALQLGKENLITYIEKFHLDNQNIIGYPLAFRKDFITPLRERNTLVNAAIGQGKVELSPVLVSSMLNTIANGGVYRRPRVVQEVVGTDGITYTRYANSTGEQVISFETAEKIQSMLRGVTQEGTGIDAYIEGYGSAGKTGTAEILLADGKTTHSWFSGYAPTNNPRYVVTVVVEKGKEERVKGTRVFKEIMEEILKVEIK